MNHYLLSHKSLLSVALSASLLAGMTSCQDEDFGYSADQIKYAKNFTELYGEIPADKSWDLSSFSNWVDVCNNTSATRAHSDVPTGPTKGQLVKDTHYSIGSEYLPVNSNLLNWMSSQLKEGYDNRYLGTSFVLRVPSNDFAIIPVFQGGSSIMSELEVKINDYKITKVWTKSENIQAKPTSEDEWQDLGYFEGNRDLYKVEAKRLQFTEEKWHAGVKHNVGDYYYQPYYPMHPASTIGDYAVQSKPIIFKSAAINKANDYMYLSLRNICKNPNPLGIKDHSHQEPDGHWVQDCFELDGTWNDADGAVNYLKTKTWDSEDGWTTVGDRLTSINPGGYMLALNVAPEAQPSAADLRKVLGLTGNEVPQCIIVGCEDANGASSDHDNNDVCFLVVGYPSAPQIVPTTEVIRKRYMCEDLGGTDDFDFNDVVIDLTQTRTINIEYSEPVTSQSFFNTGNDITNNSSVEIGSTMTYGSIEQTAKISHLCGTLPLQVRVGDYFFPAITDPVNEYQTRKDLKEAGYWKSSRSTSTLTRAEVKYNGWNPNEEKVLTDDPNRTNADALWDPETNNVKVYVDWTGWRGYNSVHQSNDFDVNETEKFYLDFSGDRNMKCVSFPNVGEVPYMIATDVNTPWMAERQHIPVDWIKTGDFSGHHEDKNPEDSSKPIIVGPGSSIYYEKYASDFCEAVLWKGSMKGAKEKTVIDLSDAGIIEGIKEAKNEKSFNIVKVYTTGEVHVSGSTYEKGQFRLCYKEGDKWVSLFDGATNPDCFIQDVEDAAHNHVTSVMLTDSQWDLVKSKGLGVMSLTNGLEFTKVTMYRIWDKDANTYQKGRVLKIAKSTNGKVSVQDRTFRTSSFGDNDYQALYPYSVSYESYTQDGTVHDQAGYDSKVILTPIANPGYVFDHWSDEQTHTFDESNPTNARVFDIAKGSDDLTISAVFGVGTNPNLKFLEEDLTVKEKSITVLLGSTKNLNISSDNQTTYCKISGYDNRIINVVYPKSAGDGSSMSIIPVAVGRTSFSIHQPEAFSGSTHYSPSEDLTVNVNVIKNLVPVHIVCRNGGSGAEDNSTYGYPTFTVDGSSSLFLKDEDDYVAVNGNSISTVNTIYVTPGTSVSITAPTNFGYSFSWSNGTTNYTRIETVGENGFTSYAQYTSQKVRELALTDVYSWSTGAADAFVISESNQWNSVYNKGTTTLNDNKAFGGLYNYYTEYVDLTAASVIIVGLESTTNLPTFYFNNKKGWADGVKVNSSTNSKYFHVVGNDVIIDIKGMHDDGALSTSYTHLNAIVAESGDLKINNIWVDAYTEPSTKITNWTDLSALSSSLLNGSGLQTSIPTGVVTEGGCIWGIVNNIENANYADLSDYAYLMIKVESGSPRVIFNMSPDKQNYAVAALNAYGGTALPWTVSEDEKTFYIKIQDVKDAFKVYSVTDAHLHGIKAIGETKIEKIQLGK